LRLGQTVIAIGNPLGELGGTVTDGIISSLAREVVMEGNGSMTLLQTNAAVSPGNSGGGLFDLYGRLIGIVNAKTSGQGVEGISFAIPVDTAWDIANQLIDRGYVSGRPSLGLPLKQVQYSAGFFGDIYSQVIVASDVDKYGLKANDIIISINGYEVLDLKDVSYSISANNIGDEVTVRIKRDRKYYELKIKLVEYIPEGVSEDNSSL
jgi:serine protease Do